MNPAGPGGSAAGIDCGGNNQGLCQVSADNPEPRPICRFRYDFRESWAMSDSEA